jgi:hypothetical protein
MTPTGIFMGMGRGAWFTNRGRKLNYLNFFSSFAFLFSLMDFAGFFLTSFLASFDFAITASLVNEHDNGNHTKAPK